MLDEIVFGKAAYPRHHHSFRLRCDQEDLVFTSDFEFHTLESPKFTPLSDNIGSLPAEEKWLYLLRHAEAMESDQLTALLQDPPFQEAIGVLEMISKNPEDLQFYEARLKFLRDQQSQIEAAEQKGIEKGRELGELRGKIQLLQEILGDTVTANEELDSQPQSDLSTLLAQLQSRLRGRKA